MVRKEQDSKLNNDILCSDLPSLLDKSKQVSPPSQETVIPNQPISQKNFTEEIQTVKLRQAATVQALTVHDDYLTVCKVKEQSLDPIATDQPNLIGKEQDSKLYDEVHSSDHNHLPDNSEQRCNACEENILPGQPISNVSFTEQIRNVKLRPTAKGQALYGYADSMSFSNFKERKLEPTANYQHDLTEKEHDSKLYNEIPLSLTPHPQGNSHQVCTTSQDTILSYQPISKSNFTEQIRNVKLRTTAKRQDLCGCADSLSFQKDEKLDPTSIYHPGHDNLPVFPDDSKDLSPSSQDAVLSKQPIGKSNFTEQIRNVKLKPREREYAESFSVHKFNKENFDHATPYHPDLIQKEKDSKLCNETMLHNLPQLRVKSSQELVLTSQRINKANFTEQIRNVKLRPTAKGQPISEHAHSLSFHHIRRKEQRLDRTATYQPNLIEKERDSKLYWQIPLSHFSSSLDSSERVSPPLHKAVLPNQLLCKKNLTKQTENAKIRPIEQEQDGYSDSWPNRKVKKERFVFSVMHWTNLIGKRRETKNYSETLSFRSLRSKGCSTFKRNVIETADYSQFTSCANVPDNIKDMSIQQVADILRLLHMQRYVKTFVESDIDGKLLMDLDVCILSNDLGLSRFHAIKLHKFIHEGWRPKPE